MVQKPTFCSARCDLQWREGKPSVGTLLCAFAHTIERCAKWMVKCASRWWLCSAHQHIRTAATSPLSQDLSRVSAGPTLTLPSSTSPQSSARR